MCVVSMVGDYYGDKWKDQMIFTSPPTFIPPVSREEFEELKREVEDMKQLLIRAKLYDEANGEPDCSMDEKLEILRRVAEMVGVDLSDVLGEKNS